MEPKATNMAEPKKKLSKSRTGRRKSHQALKKQNLSKCPKCNAIKLPHHVCSTCGYYNDEQIINFDKKDKK